ncbi:MAG: helix-turn-helix domain-containing protein [Acidobacteriota bacterium]
MSKTTDSNLFILSPLARYAAGFYQQLLRSTGTYEQFCNRLILLAERAHALRQFDKVNEIGLLLANTPIKRYQAIGYYFLAVAANSVGNGDQEKAQKLFELAVDTAPDTYKIKSILSLGAVAGNKGDIDSAMYFYRGVVKSEGLGLSGLQAMRGIAVLKAAEGYHESAIVDLEEILPIVRFTPPNVYLDCLNSYAVELAEVGQSHEAERVSSLAVASPLVHRYPEWQETWSDIRSKRKRRSTIAISRPLTEQEDEPQSEVPENMIHKARVRAVTDFMGANLQRRIAMTELAGVVNLSPVYFSHVFKAETGVPPGDYLIRLRMEKASHLLATTFLSIKQVMAAVGYNNKGNFARHFRRHFHATPSEYRKRALAVPRHVSKDISTKNCY